VDRADATQWIRAHVQPVDDLVVEHERPWATVVRVPTADGTVWFKACGPVAAFEPRLSASLHEHSPGLVAEVLGHDEERAWLLLADAGASIGVDESTPEQWQAVLPLYAEVQRAQIPYAREHVEHGVPDLRAAALPARYDDFLTSPLPIRADEIERLRAFAPRFLELCEELSTHDTPDSIQHDDLHGANVYTENGRMRVLDWGDSAIAHPFSSLVVTFMFLENVNKVPSDDPWFARLRDAYLEPWGSGLVDTFELAQRVGAVAHAIAWARQRHHLQAAERPSFDQHYPDILRWALRQTLG
jgi:hypothetical protein